MAHVITQSCVGDGSCVYGCPVNCIQPTPDDPAFELADMLHIDPATCVDCGACVRACPVDAIKPSRLLDEGERQFEQINAAYFRRTTHARPRLAPIRPALSIRDRSDPLRVAIVGSGPAATYAAEEVLTIPGARVSMFERLPHPDGLVRSGVAPDHRRTRRVNRQLERIRRDPGLTLRLGVEVGKDVTLDELSAHHHAVIYGVGAARDRQLDIPGADLPGVMPARELVGWYNGHPDHADRAVDLAATTRVVVVGNGNVALDVARILTVDPDALLDTDVAPGALAALRASRVEEVVVAGRRGPAESAFTVPELIGLTTTPGVSVAVVAEELAGATGTKADLLRALPAPRPGTRRITLRYGLTPAAVRGEHAVTGVAFGTETVDAELLLTSIGYRGVPVPGLPYDPATGTVPSDTGRIAPGTYVVGWIKRGATGSIGTNRSCAQDTVQALVEDYNAGRL